MKPNFCTDLENSDWEPFDRATNPDVAWDLMYSIILKVVNNHCPFKTYHISKKRPEYITPEIVAISRDRNYHHSMALQSPRNPELSNHHYKLALSLRKTVYKDIKNSKRSYILEKFNDGNGNPPKFWKTVSSVIPDTKSTKIDGVFAKDNYFVNGNEAANEINSFFVNIGTELNKKLPACDPNASQLFEAVPFIFDQMNEINIQAVEIKLEAIDVNKSILKINSRLLKIAWLNQKGRFCKLLNLYYYLYFSFVVENQHGYSHTEER